MVKSKEEMKRFKNVVLMDDQKCDVFLIAKKMVKTNLVNWSAVHKKSSDEVGKWLVKVMRSF